MDQIVPPEPSVAGSVVAGCEEIKGIPRVFCRSLYTTHCASYYRTSPKFFFPEEIGHTPKMFLFLNQFEPNCYTGYESDLYQSSLEFGETVETTFKVRLENGTKFRYTLLTDSHSRLTGATCTRENCRSIPELTMAWLVDSIASISVVSICAAFRPPRVDIAAVLYSIITSI